MNKILLTLCVLLSFAAVAQVNQVDSKGRKQGQWVKFYESSKVPIYTGQFKNDKPIGKFVYYYPSNEIKSIVIHDENSNRSEGYFYHENSKLLAFGIYRNQEKDSVWTHYGPSGRISFKETYKNGKLHGKRTIYYVPEIEEDNRVEVMREAYYENDRLNGPVVEYFPGGVKKLEGTYVNGAFNGIVKHYHPNGKLSIEERYKERRKHGWQIAYDQSGKEIGRAYYNHGDLLEGELLKRHMQRLKEKGINPNE
ncbi:MAG: toxin-antitoxin system YwqK family antitoxin [Brumimicrobium sp.]|nr:toxin-antitoxin system YwqK family antitoxin [Brumimicrobium sp.]